jgi:hypothetical protein
LILAGAFPGRDRPAGYESIATYKAASVPCVRQAGANPFGDAQLE